MSAVEIIKAAAAQLGPEEQAELFDWWVKTPAFKEGRLAALKREVARGVDDLENSRYRIYEADHAMRLADEVTGGQLPPTS
jgi:16S rRNA C967 or C1407 C5-methylase (RsmB/RsmF family)